MAFAPQFCLRVARWVRTSLGWGQPLCVSPAGRSGICVFTRKVLGVGVGRRNPAQCQSLVSCQDP